jgi:hypothetical protein
MRRRSASDEARRAALAGAIDRHRRRAAGDDEPANRHAAETRLIVDRHDRELAEIRHWILGLAIAVITTAALGVIFGS